VNAPTREIPMQIARVLHCCRPHRADYPTLAKSQMLNEAFPDYFLFRLLLTSFTQALPLLNELREPVVYCGLEREHQCSERPWTGEAHPPRNTKSCSRESTATAGVSSKVHATDRRGQSGSAVYFSFG
jgi:hypothetical protein